MDLRAQIKVLRARFWAVVACAAVGAASAFLVSSQLPTVYEAKASLIAQTMASTYAEVAKSRPVLAYVISTLELGVTPESLSQSVDARASQTSAVLTITARDSMASRAAAIASAIANRLVQLAPTIAGSSAEAQQAIQSDLARVQVEIARTEAAITELSNKTDQTASDRLQLVTQHDLLASLLGVRASLQTAAISYSETVLTVLALATPPAEPSSPKIALASSLGGLAGLVIGIGAVLLVAYMRAPEMRVPQWPSRPS